MNKLMEVYIKAKKSRCRVKHDDSPLNIIKRAELEDRLYTFNDDVFLCAYKTKYEDVPSIMLVFTMETSGGINGSSASVWLAEVIIFT